MFLIGYWGQSEKRSRLSHKPWMYSLCLGVSCTSWAFYGIINSAVITGHWLSYIYYGTIACFIFAWPMLLKMLRISKQQNLTSIADFISSRFEKAPQIAAVVTIIALIGTIPYIALQLRAISQSFDLVTGSFNSGINTTVMVTLVLTLFSILFGTRHLAATKQNQGLMFALAFGSIFKLMAFITIGLFVTYGLFDGFSDLLTKHQSLSAAQTHSEYHQWYFIATQVLLGFITIFVTPQLFHMIVIENQNEQQLKQARWQYPLYLVLINIFVLPIAIAGQVSFPGGSVNADTFVLTLPLFHQQQALSVLVFIGGLAAATGMVIVASIVLSTMVSTEIVTPGLLKYRVKTTDTGYAKQLLLSRRIAIGGIMLAALMFERLVNQQSHLSSIGTLSFVLLCQFAPAVIAALYWRRASSYGALVGLIVGTFAWAYTLLLPLLMPDSNTVVNGLFSVAWLKPEAMFGLNGLDAVSHGLVISLLSNVLCFVLVSLYSKRSVGERLQAEVFLKKQHSRVHYDLTKRDLETLLKRFVNQEAALELQRLYSVNNDTSHKPTTQATTQEYEFTRQKLASVLGTTSTRLVMNAAAENSDNQLALEQVADIVDEANQLFEFNRELLQAGVENIEQGISVVDADMRLVAWNQRYIELLDYPKEIIQAGMPISELLRFNAQRGMLTVSNLDIDIERRIQHMKDGNTHYFRRILPSGVVLEIRGQPMPGGGFVSTFSDITQHIEAERALQQANDNLEQKVTERTKELSLAKAEAEQANQSKSRFLAAASHDLMQPFNALSLFTDMLKQQAKDTDLLPLTEQIQDSLTAVEGLLSDLVEISKLDSAKHGVEQTVFNLEELFKPLSHEFSAMCAQQGITFRYLPRNITLNTDKKLLRRVIQNFLSNAVRYSQQHSNKQAKILLGAKRYGDEIMLQVWDNGPGIPIDKQQLIFREFERLENNSDTPGLGLGLAISERISKLLYTELHLHSTVGKGSMFGIKLPISKETSEVKVVKHDSQDKSPKGFEQLNVLLIDNDPRLLSALEQQLLNWGCNVVAVKNRQQWQSQEKQRPDLIIADYHLDDGDNGVEFVIDIFVQQNWQTQTVICSADPCEQLRQKVSDANFSFIKKPLKSLALKRLLKQAIEQKQ